MRQTIQVIYEHGVLKPVGKVNIPERSTLDIVILEADLSSSLVSRVAEQGGSYDFLRRAAEDIYTADDGEAL